MPSATMQEPRLALKTHIMLERDAEDEDIVLIDSRSGRMTACNETATLVMTELQGGSTLRGLVEAIVRRFKVTHEQAMRDVNALLDVLAAEGFLETRD